MRILLALVGFVSFSSAIFASELEAKEFRDFLAGLLARWAVSDESYAKAVACLRTKLDEGDLERLKTIALKEGYDGWGKHHHTLGRRVRNTLRENGFDWGPVPLDDIWVFVAYDAVIPRKPVEGEEKRATSRQAEAKTPEDQKDTKRGSQREGNGKEGTDVPAQQPERGHK
ncbi:MAG: hypothetical protein NTW87_14050 [Planctomycetota bacterium]|nr:hypothetical protein [Planctomycetota bacterium]